MNVRVLSVLFAVAATGVLSVASARAQAVPFPQPRPAHLTARPIAPAVPDVSATASVAQPSVASAPAPTAPAVSAPMNLTAPTPPAPTPAPAPARVAAANPAQSGGQGATLRKVNDYFNSIRNLTGNFTQVGPDGSTAGGKFFIAKPGKMRFYYQRPSTTDIIADGKSLVVRDRRLATQDVYPLSQTPLKFLLASNLNLAKDSKVAAVYEEPGLISVAIEEETTFGGKARVLIVFATNDGVNYELKQWTITDAQGLNTTISVSEIDTAAKPDDKLFVVDYTRYNR